MLGAVVAASVHVKGHPLPREARATDYFSEWRERLGANHNPVSSAYMMEFTGTFYLSLTVALSVAGFDNASASEVAPFAIGSSLMIAVYFGGHVSGGHYNPAVTLGCALIGKLPLHRAPGYMALQVGMPYPTHQPIPASVHACMLGTPPYMLGTPHACLVLPIHAWYSPCTDPCICCVAWRCKLAGAFAAGGVAANLLDGVPHEISCGFPTADPGVPTFRLVLCEAVFSFFLVTVVMFTATTKRNEGNDYYGFAIGMTVFVGAIAIGGVSGAALNPAVGTGLPIVCGKGEFVWVSK